MNDLCAEAYDPGQHRSFAMSPCCPLCWRVRSSVEPNQSNWKRKTESHLLWEDLPFLAIGSWRRFGRKVCTFRLSSSKSKVLRKSKQFDELLITSIVVLHVSFLNALLRYEVRWLVIFWKSIWETSCQCCIGNILIARPREKPCFLCHRKKKVWKNVPFFVKDLFCDGCSWPFHLYLNFAMCVRSFGYQDYLP